MRLIARRGLLARKVRLALTALSIALGVTLIAGTYVFTDTINGSFEGIFGATYGKTDVVVSADTDLSGDNAPPPVPGALIDKVKDVDGVATAEGSVFWPGLIARKPDGSKLKGVGFNAVSSTSGSQFATSDYVDGGPPQTADEVAIFKSTAETEGLETGDQLLLSSAAPAKLYVISGIYTLAGVDSFGGGVIGTFTLPEASGSRGSARTSRRSTSSARMASQRPRCERGSRRRCAVHLGSTCSTGADSGGRSAVGQHQQRLPRNAAHGAVGVRRYLPLRRRLPDLQHVLDHGGSADAGVRALAHSWRQARPDPAVGAVRGLGTRRARVADRTWFGGADGEAGCAAVQGLRRRHAGRWHGRQLAHRGRLAAWWAS